MIFFLISRKNSFQSFICFDREGLLKPVFINFSHDKIQSSGLASVPKYEVFQQTSTIASTPIIYSKRPSGSKARINRKIDNMFIHIYPLIHDN